MGAIDPLKRNWINSFSLKGLGFLGGSGSVWVELGRVARHRLSRVRAGLKNLGAESADWEAFPQIDGEFMIQEHWRILDFEYV